MRIDGRPDHIEDYLVTVRTGQWFGLASLQAAWDLENNSYKSKRREVYPSQAEQFDMQYWDAINGTTTWKDAITKVKSDFPKPS